MNDIHPSSVIYPGVTIRDSYIGPGCIIGAPPEIRDWSGEGKGVMIVNARLEGNVTVDAGSEKPTEILNGTMIMKGAHIGHDARVGMNVTISPHVCVGGHVTILPFANIGMGAVIHQFQVIGHAAMVGMGSVVTKKSRVMPGEIWAGNPVRHLGVNTKGIIRAGATRETMAYWHELFYNLTKDLK